MLLVAAALPAVALAQGKIAGRVTDATTGEPLIGVNVVLGDTQQGTVTNVDGDYVLLNVRPGTHTVNFSYIGFQTQQVEGVRAVTGQTTRLDVEMQEQVIQGQEVVVQAERPLVQKDLTSSRTTVNAEEIENLPVEGFLDVLTTQAGVTQGPSGEIHIRGGRSNEVAYLVDGMSVGNPFNTNGLATNVAQDAIQEMTVISGAFNAEYGKAMSGIVNLVTKEGGNSYEGSASFYGGDRVTSHDDIFLSPNDVGLSVYTIEGSLSGPVPFWKKLKFFASFRRDVDDGYIYGRRMFAPSDSANFNADPDRIDQIRAFLPDYDREDAWYYEIQGKPWYEYVANGEDIPSEAVSMNGSEGTNFIGKLSIRPWQSVKLEYSYLLDSDEYTPFNFAYRFNPDGVSRRYDDSYNHALHWTQTLSDRMFYTARFSYQNHSFDSYLYDVGLCDDDARLDGSCVDQVDERYVSDGLIRGFPGNNFLFGGNQKGHVHEQSRSLRSKVDVTRQFGVIHEVKVGGEFVRHRLDRRNFVILYDGDTYRTPTIPSTDSPSHDVYENQLVTEFSAYAQDKLEFNDFIINAGLRYERFNPHGEYIPSLLAVDEYTELNPEQEPRERPDAEVTNLLLPRLGVSFPITERGIIHFSYGHFAQMPSLRQMYVNPEFEFARGSTPLFGNTNMRPERTVQYEMGLQQQLGEQLAINVTGFFKDIRDYLAQQTIRFSTVAGEDVYSIYLNRDYANVKGVTFSLTKRRSRSGLLSATVDYTYQVAEGNNNETNAFFFNFLSGRENELELIPLSFDQRHVVSGTVTLTRPGSWGLSLIGQFATGYPYTPLVIDQQLDVLPNNGRKPSQYKLDLQVYKDFDVGERVSLRAFGKVFNVLDHLNERFVFDTTGRATYDLDIANTHATWAPFYSLPGIQTLETYNTRPQYYSAPRQIRLGATLSF